MRTDVTCGPLLKEAMDAVYALKVLSEENTENNDLLIMAGFMLGQMEKVYLGACGAAMFRPFNQDLDFARHVVLEAAKVYDLEHQVIPSGATEGATEIWVYRHKWATVIEHLKTLKINSPEAHTLRALLCGINPSEIDTDFHLRKGWELA